MYNHNFCSNKNTINCFEKKRGIIRARVVWTQHGITLQTNPAHANFLMISSRFPQFFLCDLPLNSHNVLFQVESLGSDRGPDDIEVELKSSSDVRKTTTKSGGSFFFTPVYPGNYVVKISSSKSVLNFRKSVTIRHFSDGNSIKTVSM